ncbi:MAG: CHASE2 domain-containing protein, partial [Bdellovibrionota bacterium]
MKRMRLKINRKLFSNGIKIAFALALSFVLNQFPMDQIEFFAYDLLFRAKANNSTSGEIAIVNIDRNSIEQLRHEPDLTDYTLLMQQLKELSPKAVLFLPDLNRIEANQNQKAAFARSTEEINNFIVSVEDVPLAGAENKFKLSTPLHHINVQPGILSKDSRNFAQDNVSRRALVHYEGHYFAQAQIAQLINPVKDPMDYQGAFPFKGSIQVLVNLHKKGSFNTFSFIDVVDGNINKEDLKNKIIVIGQDAQSEADNYVMTPFLRDVTAMSKAEYNANIIDGLIKDNSIIQTS